MPTTELRMRLALLIVCAWLLAGCGKSATQPAEAAPSTAAKAVPTTTATTPFNVAGIFPSGTGRELVLNTCGSCHSAICAIRGQRTAEQWENIKKGHKDKLASTSGADLNAMFSYLAANFNDTRPEPQVPAELLQQGCTPF